MSQAFIQKTIIHFNLNSGKKEIEDFIAVEKEITLSLNQKRIYSFSCTPTYIKELILGFLINQNLIKDYVFLKSIEVEENLDKILVKVEFLEENAFDSEIIKKNNFKIEAIKILELFKDFIKTSKIFEITGATHSACLADKEKILFSVEDIRRHNAIDKVVGWAYLNKINLEDKMLFISSRISSEIVKKAVQAQIPLVISRGAPTSLAIKLAEEKFLTLIGFLREKRFNIYSHPQRIILG